VGPFVPLAEKGRYNMSSAFSTSVVTTPVGRIGERTFGEERRHRKTKLDSRGYSK